MIALLEEFRERLGVPAVIGGVADRQGNLDAAVAGRRRRDRPSDPATIDDRWHIGSCMPFEEALEVHVLEPLGIDSLGYGPPPTVCGHGSRLQLGPIAIGSAAPALIEENMSRAALVVVNDGRSRVLRQSGPLARDLLKLPPRSPCWGRRYRR